MAVRKLRRGDVVVVTRPKLFGSDPAYKPVKVLEVDSRQRMALLSDGEWEIFEDLRRVP